MQLNPDKCKELRISFNTEPRSFVPIVLHGKVLEVVTSAKLLGLTINNKIKWKPHIDDVGRKVNKRIYFLKNLIVQMFHIEIWLPFTHIKGLLWITLSQYSTMHCRILGR